MNTSLDTTRIQLNGQAHDTSATTVLHLVSDLTGHALHRDGSSVDGVRLGVAVAVDGAVVPRGQWHARAIEPNQRIEVVTAKQGG